MSNEEMMKTLIIWLLDGNNYYDKNWWIEHTGCQSFQAEALVQMANKVMESN